METYDRVMDTHDLVVSVCLGIPAGLVILFGIPLILLAGLKDLKEKGERLAEERKEREEEKRERDERRERDANAAFGTGEEKLTADEEEFRRWRATSLREE